ncbi:SAM-dependent methyltransferase [Streptomyces sp. b94]|uniref:SAM-dependent methyltransferase n=1 Tax=Streptomyces sp. b94 TaxID=1827634 RepID=UPI001B369A5E|nr:SAM-dependent methyltransferase [Streptomyces sp. b94]MBQ1098495.1 SAM-dependent methyltransferase [Streptomyces sp. b94]
MPRPSVPAQDHVANTDAGGESHPTTETGTSVPHSARVRNHWLGGKDNYPVDAVRRPDPAPDGTARQPIGRHGGLAREP